MTAPAGPLFEVAGREDTRSPVAGRPAQPWRLLAMLLPATVLVGLVLVLPLLATIGTSLRVDGGGLGMGNYTRILADPQVRHAIANSLRWLAIAPLVCLVGFGFAWLGRDLRWSRAFLVGVVAAPMAVSALVAGMTFRLMFDPQPDRGTVTALVFAVQDWVGGAPELPGARPADGTLAFDPASGDVSTVARVPSGTSVHLGLTGVPDPVGPPYTTGALPPAGAFEVAGVVSVDGVRVAGVPVTVSRLDFARTTRTGPDGTFRFDVADQPLAATADYGLRIPAAAVAPGWDGVAFLGPAWIWWVLGSAFAWSWVGLAVVIFRAGLAGVPADLLRMARAYGAGRLRRVRTVVVPALIPVTAMVLLTLLVAAARVFDLVLVGAPGSVQADADVVGLHWWRSHDLLGAGGSAALAVLLFLCVAAVALVALWGLNRPWPRSTDPAPDPPPRSRPRRWAVRAAVAAAVAVWLVPFLVLLLTSLRDPRDAAVAGWWAAGGWGWDSYRAAFASGELAGSLLATTARAVSATALLLLVAVPAAYALSGEGLSRRARATLVTGTAVLAVVPVQAVAGPLGRAIDALRLSGAPTALTLVHVAFGVPFAVLLLRPAFQTAPREPAAGRPGPDSGRVWAPAAVARSWPSILAVAVLEFTFVWNDLVVGLVLGGPENGPVTLALLGQARQFATSSGVMAAGAVVCTAVPLVLVLASGKWVVRGLTVGVTR